MTNTTEHDVNSTVESIEQAAGIECLSENVCFSLYTASNALVRAYRPLLDQYELTFPQYLVMQCLWRRDGLGMTALSNITKLDLGTLTPIVKRLESKEFVDRKVDSDDERRKIIMLTSKGRALQQQAAELKQSLLKKVSISEEQLEQFRQLCLILTTDLNDN